MQPPPYDVFLSHNSHDKPFVEELAKHLKEHKLRLFLDKWNLIPGAAWQPELEEAMKSCTTAAIFFGPTGDGPFHNAEMQVLFSRAQRERGEFRLIGVLLPGVDIEKIPSFMQLRTAIDFGKDPFEVALKRLIAGVRGEPPEDGNDYTLPDEPTPYLSLKAFDAQQATLFFGRDPDIVKLVQKLVQPGFIAVVGASGSGKSSLVRAGLATKLALKQHSDLAHWQLLVVIPGSDPLRNLARSNLKRLDLAEGDFTPRVDQDIRRFQQDAQAFVNQLLDREGNWLVIIDQFEEVFTQGHLKTVEAHSLREQTAAFIAILHRTVQQGGGRVRVLLTLRADFLHHCLEFPVLKDLLQDNQFLLGPLTETGLREAIVKPAQQVGALFEKGLVERILADVLGQAGSLPLLQHSLHELWQKRRGAWLTNAAYDETGGVEGALRQRADKIYGGLNERQQQIARNIFLRLTTLGEGVSDTRRRANRSELSSTDFAKAEIDEVIKSLSGDQARLIEASEETVEVTHEALIQKWPTLGHWLDANRADLRIHRQLTEAANEWVKSHPEPRQRDPSLLYTGSRMAAARELSQQGKATLNELEGAFLSTSLQAVQAKKRRVVAGWVGTLTVIGLLAAIGAIVATNRQNQAVAKTTVEKLLSAEPAEVPAIVKQLAPHRERVVKSLVDTIAKDAKTPDEKRQQRHARMAVVGHDKSQVTPLLEDLLSQNAAYIGPISEQLRPYAGELTEKLWGILRNDQAIDKHPAKHRLHAAAALAHYVPDSAAESWTEADLQFVTDHLVAENAEFQPLLRKNLQPLSEKLQPDLEQIFSDPKSTDGQRLGAANAIAEYAANDIPRLSRLLSVATPEQFRLLYPMVEANRATTTVEILSKIAATLPSVDLGTVARIGFGQQRANAAVALMRLGEREQAISVFELTDDPEALTQFIFRCRDREVSAETLLDCLDLVSQASADQYPKNSRYGLLLALGQYSLEKEIPEARREALVAQLSDWYRHDPSSGVHGASGWLLRQWGQTEIARQVDQTSVPYTEGCEWFTLAIPVITVNLLTQKPNPPETFYYTFIVFTGGDYKIGSSDDEPDRDKTEFRTPVTLTQPFAILDREITMAELVWFKPEAYSAYAYMANNDTKPADAGFGLDWYDSVRFCRWLSLQSGCSEADQSYADPAGLDPTQYPPDATPSAKGAPLNWPLAVGKRGFRLPTETEWEVASRAGARTSYGFGSDTSLLGQFGWFQGNSGKHVHPPRELRPSLRGVFDQHGNLFEWTHDWYSSFLIAAVDPRGSVNGSRRVDRGGSWSTDAADCRLARRWGDSPIFRTTARGFRVALSPSGASSPEAAHVQRAEPLGGGTEGAPAEQRPEMP